MRDSSLAKGRLSGLDADLRSIKRTFRDLAVEKAARYSMLLAGEGDEDDDAESLHGNDPTYEPGGDVSRPAAQARPARNAPQRVRNDAWTCFAASNGDHQDASELQKLGVWLGSQEDPDAVITDFSLNDLLEKYHHATNGGRVGLRTTEPLSNADHYPNPPRDLACASCLHRGRAVDGGMVAKNIPLHHKDLRRMVSVDSPLPCEPFTPRACSDA